jgi:hypothetical protein
MHLLLLIILFSLLGGISHTNIISTTSKIKLLLPWPMMG